MANFVYFSCVPGHLVTRMSALTMPGPLTYIGARRRKGGKVEYNADEVVAVPLAEFNRFRKEYTRCLRNKSLVERTAKDHTAWLKQQKEESSKAARAPAPEPDKKPPEPAEEPPKILQAVESDEVPRPAKKRSKKSKGVKKP